MGEERKDEEYRVPETGEKRFKSMLNKFNDLRLSSPKFYMHAASTHELSSKRQEYLEIRKYTEINELSAMKDYCDSIIDKQ